MISGLYSASTALEAARVNQEIVADNLANVSTPGFRRHGLVFEAVQQQALQNTSGSTGSGTRSAGQYNSFTAGPLQHTGNPFDLALSGSDGSFFVLDGPAGPVYTRNGVFQINSVGQLQSASGMPVRGEGGRITLPQGTSSVTIGSDGTVYANSLGNSLAVGKLQIAQFPQPGNVLARVGTTLFSGPPARQSQNAPNYRVEQGYREGSNVQVVNEMVSMITGMRYYEAAERALRALGEAVSQNTKPQ
jgi:flagellar basal body rod protein FlgG